MISWKNAVATLGVAALAATAQLVAPPAASASGEHQHATIAKLFRGTARAELREHFAEEAVLAGLVGTNAANLERAIDGEMYEYTAMYPDYAAQAVRDHCAVAADLFTEIAADEGNHAAAFTTALRSLTDPAVGVPQTAKVDPVAITAGGPACPGTRTQDNLLAAMHGEAFAWASYTAWAQQAARR